MAADKVEMEKSEGDLKHLGFVRVFTINAAVLVSNLYEYAKQNSGPLKSTVGTIENAVATVVKPVYERLKGVPDKVLVFLDSKVDEGTAKFDEHAPPLVKKVVSKARSITCKASEVAQDLYKEVQVAGPRAAIYHVGAMYKQLVICLLVALWYHVNRSSALHKMALIVAMIVSHLFEQYNQLVVDWKKKGYVAVGYIPLIPVEELSKAYKQQVESAAAKKDDPPSESD